MGEGFSASGSFASRHIGPPDEQIHAMLQSIGLSSLDQLIDETIPKNIRAKKVLELPTPKSEHEALLELKSIASTNQIKKSYLGCGYYGTIVPSPIKRHIFENASWYTQYTPYQAEIAQGRLEALLNFQTVISELTALPVANASLLDESTAAAEAMALAFSHRTDKTKTVFLLDQNCHPQTIEVVLGRAEPLGIEIKVAAVDASQKSAAVFGVLLQNPGTDGQVLDQTATIAHWHQQGSLVIVATDLLACAIVKAPGEQGADMAIGSSQRFGVPLGFGGPHAGFIAVRDDLKRKLPGRIVGVSLDKNGNKAIRLALQTREQHIRRDKATSNICTAQVLLAIMASMYAVYHGPAGLKQIAQTVHRRAVRLTGAIRKAGYDARGENFFDTVKASSSPESMQKLRDLADAKGINLRWLDSKTVTVAVDEATTESDLDELIGLFAAAKNVNAPAILADAKGSDLALAGPVLRTSSYLQQPVFNQHHSETKLTRYIKSLESKDLSLTHSMIPLGSCTMKLNAASELFPVSWPEFSSLHPHAPEKQTLGYRSMFTQLETWLGEITGFDGVSLQPNSGAQGEYAGLLVIRAYMRDRGQGHRNVCLIPTSAHGTNPASAVMAGFKVVGVNCLDNGDIDVEDLKAKIAANKENLGALMVTYPSTHGVFEETITQICELIHAAGGQVYMDGANMNAQVGICRPADIGADVCHLNLHKTFCIPHGGGGPGVGPIGVKAHLKKYLPNSALTRTADQPAIPRIAAASFGSASILPISWMYIRMMGAEGLRQATKVAILNANYIAAKLEPHYPILYVGKNGRVAHECIIDLRKFKTEFGVEVEDVAKRLMDYGFHAPTISWPVPGTMMIEPTESEDQSELDRFCDAMISIAGEIKASKGENTLLKNAPHTVSVVTANTWNYPYTREQAAFPLPWVKERKFWPPVGRIDSAYGDRNLVCTCPSVEDLAE